MLIPLATFMVACSSSMNTTIQLPATIKMHVGDSATIRGTSWTLVFDSVASDSRCPVDVECIQAGEAVLAMQLANPLAEPQPPDNPRFTLGAQPVTAEGFRFTQLEITPVRHVNQAIAQKSYAAKLRIEQVSP